MIVSICGGSGSGKTTLARLFNEDTTVVISQDDFYFGNWDELNHLENKYDHPDSCDLNQLYEAILALEDGERFVEIPKYDFQLQKRVGIQTVVPKKIILVEGIWTLYHEGLRNVADLRIFVDTSFPERLARNLTRDKERGRNIFEAMDHAKDAEVMFQKYVEPYKKYADLTLYNFDSH